MKKLLSVLLAVVTLAGMFVIGATAEDTNTMLKYDDIPMGYAASENYNGYSCIQHDRIADGNFTLSMDFIYGRSGACVHTEKTLTHSSKLAINVGKSEGTYKYFGYNATEDFFFVAKSELAEGSGEGNGYDYLKTSEKGLVKPGVKYRLDFVLGDSPEAGDSYDYCLKILLDGAEVLSIDMYADLVYYEYFPYDQSKIAIYPNHMTCFIDNVTVTAEGEDAPFVSTDFETWTEGNGDAETGSGFQLENWVFNSAVYTLSDTTFDIYAQLQNTPAEGQANIIFKSGLDKKTNGKDEMFRTGMDFAIPVTIKNNGGFDKLEMDLMADPFITVTGVTAAEGLTATLGETDANGLTKLTVIGKDYKGEDLVTLTYRMGEKAVQGHEYGYGVKTDTVTAEGNIGDVVVTNGISTVYNYTIGDVNDDGKFNVNDVLYMLRLLAKENIPGAFIESCDVNGDLRRNTQDASYYLKWLAKWPNDFVINGIAYDKYGKPYNV